MAGSQEAVLVQASAVAKLKKELNDLRDPAITPAPVVDATMIQIQPAQPSLAPGKIVLTQEGGAWKVVQADVSLPADLPVVTDMLAALRDLRANKYLDAAGDVKTIGLDPPQGSITPQLPGQERNGRQF